MPVAPDRWVRASEMYALYIALRRIGGKLTIPYHEMVTLPTKGEILFQESPIDNSFTLTLIGDSPDETQVKRPPSGPLAPVHARPSLEGPGQHSPLEADDSSEGRSDLH